MNWLERLSIMDSEKITEEQVWISGEIRDIPHILEPEIRTDVPGLDQAFVWGDPFELGKILDGNQGDNPYNARGTCGETSIANICRIAGMNVTEPEVLEYAMQNDLCQKYDPWYHGGDTKIGDHIALLEHFGLEAHCEFAGETAVPERLAEAVEGGHGVMVGLNSGILQDREWKMGEQKKMVVAEHMVCLTGTVRDMDRNLKGFYLCDSAARTEDSTHIFVPIEKFNACYTNVKNGCAVITDNPIR